MEKRRGDEKKKGIIRKKRRKQLRGRKWSDCRGYKQDHRSFQGITSDKEKDEGIILFGDGGHSLIEGSCIASPVKVIFLLARGRVSLSWGCCNVEASDGNTRGRPNSAACEHCEHGGDKEQLGKLELSIDSPGVFCLLRNGKLTLDRSVGH